MTNKIYCPVCRVSFVSKEAKKEGDVVTCTVCGAKLLVTEPSPEVRARRFPQSPRDEIYDRVETYARLKGYVFNESKELVMEGLMEKMEKYGDFYCPCRFDNVPENICPCLETRKGEVRREGTCL